ncbi:hypothetical protein [Nocardioides sp. CFH 31398]|uniref:hypothetical protein n=1 Tax=Nocardioides sp. CFH 31398 TaxID=2919579 RepID=UPI001F063A88|nr:hypothetical protein [Nocardioides sp. CFH 31398]MCH1867992.1 hypothetical protein [Nocardioides sp. CFH 31398]
MTEPGGPEDTLEDWVPGTVIRAFWDYDGPLWTEEGPLPSDTRWLRDVLGLSDSLAAEIDDWSRQLLEWPAHSSIPTASLRRQGDRIRRRLTDELAGRYEVRWEL